MPSSPIKLGTATASSSYNYASTARRSIAKLSDGTRVAVYHDGTSAKFSFVTPDGQVSVPLTGASLSAAYAPEIVVYDDILYVSGRTNAAASSSSMRLYRGVVDANRQNITWTQAGISYSTVLFATLAGSYIDPSDSLRRIVVGWITTDTGTGNTLNTPHAAVFKETGTSIVKVTDTLNLAATPAITVSNTSQTTGISPFVVDSSGNIHHMYVNTSAGVPYPIFYARWAKTGVDTWSTPALETTVPSGDGAGSNSSGPACGGIVTTGPYAGNVFFHLNSRMVIKNSAGITVSNMGTPSNTASPTIFGNMSPAGIVPFMTRGGTTNAAIFQVWDARTNTWPDTGNIYIGTGITGNWASAVNHGDDYLFDYMYNITTGTNIYDFYIVLDQPFQYDISSTTSLITVPYRRKISADYLPNGDMVFVYNDSSAGNTGTGAYKIGVVKYDTKQVIYPTNNTLPSVPAAATGQPILRTDEDGKFYIVFNKEPYAGWGATATSDALYMWVGEVDAAFTTTTWRVSAYVLRTLTSGYFDSSANLSNSGYGFTPVHVHKEGTGRILHLVIHQMDGDTSAQTTWTTTHYHVRAFISSAWAVTLVTNTIASYTGSDYAAMYFFMMDPVTKKLYLGFNDTTPGVSCYTATYSATSNGTWTWASGNINVGYDGYCNLRFTWNTQDKHYRSDNSLRVMHGAESTTYTSYLMPVSGNYGGSVYPTFSGKDATVHTFYAWTDSNNGGSLLTQGSNPAARKSAYYSRFANDTWLGSRKIGSVYKDVVAGWHPPSGQDPLILAIEGNAYTGAAGSSAVVGLVPMYAVANVAPTAPTITSPAANSINYNSVQLEGSATDTDGGNLSIYWEYSADGGTTWNPIVTTGPLASGTTHTYTWDVSALTSGAYQIRARAKDDYDFGSYCTAVSFNVAALQTGSGTSSTEITSSGSAVIVAVGGQVSSTTTVTSNATGVFTVKGAPTAISVTVTTSNTQSTSEKRGSGTDSTTVTTQGAAVTVPSTSGNVSVVVTSSANAVSVLTGQGSSVTTVTTRENDAYGGAIVIVTTSGSGVLVAKGTGSSSTQVTTSGAARLTASGNGNDTTVTTTSGAASKITSTTGSSTTTTTTSGSGSILILVGATPQVSVVTTSSGSGIVTTLAPRYQQLDVYDLDDRRVAILTPESDGIGKVMLEEELNGPLTLTFELPLPNDKLSYLNNANYIIRIGDDYEFTPDVVTDGRSNDNATIFKGKYVGSYKELAQSYEGVVQSFMYRGDARGCLEAIVAGTNWTVGIVDVPTVERRLITELESRLSLLQHARELWGGDLVFDTVNKTVSLRQSYGSYRNVQVRYGKNVLEIERSTDLNVITRLYPFGDGSGDAHDRHNIGSVNDGKLYIDDFSYTSKISEGTYVNTDYDDPSDLKAKAQEVLSYYCKPRVSYTTNFVDLSRIVGYEIEYIALGDTVAVIDDDLGFDFEVRVVRKKWNVFVPEVADLELSNVRNDIADDFSKLLRSGKVIDETMSPGGYLPAGFLQGFINAATNEIRSANSRVRWTDGDIIAEELNPITQTPTGRIVRLNSGGIGISTDGGQHYTTAMTGAGIVADVITSGMLNAGLVNIINATGSMKITGLGLEIWDTLADPPRKRVHLGEYLANTFGLQITARDGVTAIVDERGLLQTWQVQDADNVDGTHPVSLKVYVPGDTASIRRAYLNFTLEKFRAYSKSAASGGGAAVTSDSGGGTNATSSSGGGTTATSSSGGGTNATSSSGGSTVATSGGGQWFTESGYTSGLNATDYQGEHNHGITPGMWLAVSSTGADVTGYQMWVQSGGHDHIINLNHSHTVTIGNHSHTVTVPNHTHDVTIANHTHTVTVPNHSHSVTIPDHTHGIVYGIYEGTYASGVKIKINGIDRTVDLGGGSSGFSFDEANLNVTAYLAIGNWNTIELSSTQMGRINAVLFMQAFMEIL